MRVEADLFSGRPNPEWELDSGHARELTRRLGALARSGEPAPPDPGLGYRGVVVTGAEEAAAGCEEVRVRGARVTALCGGAPREYTDPDRALERWLLDTAEGRVDPDTLRRVREAAEGSV